MKTACIAFARGCPRSMLDAAKFVDYFKINGWKITTNFRKADIVLVGTCGFEIEHENQSIKFLSIANRKMNKNAQLVAFGCLAGINEPRILEEFNITTITRSTRDRLDKMINAETNISDIEEANDLSEYTDYIQKSFTSFDNLIAKSEVEFSKEFFRNVISSLSSGGVFTPFKKLYHRVYDDRNVYDSYKMVNDQRVFNLRVGTGCNGLCTYCAIKIAVGHLKSTPSDIILKQFEDGLSKGYKIFRLVADDVGAYGQDDGADIIQLLSKLFDNKESFQLSFDDFSPKWLIKYFPELSEIFSNNIDRLCYMGFPLQAGSEKILELMKREYTANDAKKCILALKQKANDLPIYTHVIVGFPNEEEEDFQASMKFFETVPFKGVASYKYSDRPNTPASEMFPKVSEEIKKERLMRLNKVIKQSNGP